MATYDLSQSSLLALLNSTVQSETENALLAALSGAGLFPGAQSSIPVDTYIGPSGGAASPNNPETTSATAKFDFLVLPTSTINPAAPYTTPSTQSSSTALSKVFFTTPGHVVVGVGDQNIKLVDSGAGGDTVVGGVGTQVLLSTSLAGNVLMGGTGLTTLTGGAGFDTLVGGGNSKVFAGGGNQVLKGGVLSSAHDSLYGGAGADTLSVTNGNNHLTGGSGFNTAVRRIRRRHAYRWGNKQSRCRHRRQRTLYLFERNRSRYAVWRFGAPTS